MPVPLDEYPIHQAPVSLRHFGTSDRNVYDRCIMHCFARDGAVEMITGLGVYPALGVIDAYATARRGDRQWVVRSSDALGDDRMQQRVGPIRFEVVEPLEQIRAVCEGDEHGLAFDLTFTGAFPAVEEPNHRHRLGGQLILDACRFVQTGGWSGTMRIDGEDLTVADPGWSGTRDRSWGIRPVGEAQAPGRPPATEGGFWWVWCPLRFDDFAVVVIAQEHADGHRVLSEAVRIWPSASGRGVEQLGWPELEIDYAPGTRHPERARIHLMERPRRPLTIEVETLEFVSLSIGCGYGGDPDWTHGEWKGEGWVQGAVYDLTDAALLARVPFTNIDHVARATLDGAVGTGIFEHASIGRHEPTGFATFDAVAP